MWTVLAMIFGWFLFALFEGITEARLWHHKYKVFNDKIVNKVDSHLVFSIQRGFVLLLMSLVTFLLDTNNPIWVFVLFLLANALTFSFIHNGMMYTHRNHLSKKSSGKEIYPKKWFDQSNTSTAVMTKVMTPVSRTVQFVVGIVLYVIIFILI